MTLPAYHGEMLGGGTITLFHVRGIRIAVDWSWFLILFLVIFWMSNFYSELLGESAASSTPFILAVASAAGSRMSDMPLPPPPAVLLSITG